MTDKIETLNEFYKNFLKSVHIIGSDDGPLLGHDITGGPGAFNPVMVNGKRLALPTKEVLNDTETLKEVIVFHPLSENTLRGESDVIKMLKKTITFNLAFTATITAQALAEIACTPEKQKGLTAKQAAFLSNVPHANDKTLKVINKLLEKHFDSLISIYLKRDGQIDGTDYRRVAVVSFPIMEELASEGNKIFGIDAGSQKNKKTIAEFFQFILASNKDWSFGSSFDSAPYFHALGGFFANYAKHLNAIVYKYRKYVDEAEHLQVDVDSWLDYFTNTEKMKELKRAVPAMEGNIGSAAKGEAEVTDEADKTSNVSNKMMERLTSVANSTFNNRTSETTQVAATGTGDWRSQLVNRPQEQTLRRPEGLQQPEFVERRRRASQHTNSGGNDWRSQMGINRQRQRSVGSPLGRPMRSGSIYGSAI